MHIRSSILFGAAAACSALFGLAAPAIGSGALQVTVGRRSAARARSRGLRGSTEASMTTAGYGVQAATVNMTVTATLVVPKIRKCGAGETGITASAYLQTESSYSSANLFIGCEHGKATYFPVVVANGKLSKYPSLHASPGDKVVVTVSEDTTAAKVSVVDKTHKSVRAKIASAVGSSMVGGPAVGDLVWYNARNREEGVPDFGKISFSAAKLSGVALGSYGALVIRLNRVSSDNVLQIKTTKFASNHEDFTTVFEHS